MENWLTTLGLAMGSAWLSGIRLYATVATLGLLQHFGYAHLPGDLAYLGDWWVIAAASALLLVEFIADKIPAIDSVWDAVHTFIRIPAGAVLAAQAFAHFPARIWLLAMLAGGMVAFTSHGAKAATRLAVNTSPEPFSNIAVSLLEDVMAIGATLLLVAKPVLVLVLVMLFTGTALWIAPRVWRAVTRLLRRLPFLRHADPTP